MNFELENLKNRDKPSRGRRYSVETKRFYNLNVQFTNKNERRKGFSKKNIIIPVTSTLKKIENIHITHMGISFDLIRKALNYFIRNDFIGCLILSFDATSSGLVFI